MTFDKSKVYTALNADESLIGAKGYFANTIGILSEMVKKNTNGFEQTLDEINAYALIHHTTRFQFFYLVEPAPEKWYVYKIIGSDNYTNPVNYPISKKQLAFEGTKEKCVQFISEHSKPEKWYVFECSDGSYSAPSKHIFENYKLAFTGFSKEECEQWIEEHSKPKYRPFKDCDELITHFINKYYIGICEEPPKHTVPTIWLINKEFKYKTLITEFYTDNVTLGNDKIVILNALFGQYTFLDGSPCGVEEA